jgi:NAD+ synthase (glutamine-hydrolysing)
LEKLAFIGIKSKSKINKGTHFQKKLSMKILIAQLNPTIGDLVGNTENILKTIELGKKKGVDCILFPEMTICGYAPDDLLLHESFITEMEDQLDKIVRASKDIAVVVGLVRRNPSYEEKNLLNSAAVIDNGVLVGFYDKWLLPTYDVFNERRYFSRGKNIHVWNIAGKRVGIVICEDMWQNAGQQISGTSYTIDPVKELIPYKPDILFNLTASPFQSAKADVRVQVCRAAVKTLSCPVVYACQVGANGTVICDGYSLYIDKGGNICKIGKGFVEDFIEVDTEAHYSAVLFEHGIMADMQEALVLGIKDYFKKSKNRQAVVGITGRVDSAIVSTLAVQALGKENVLGIHLPCKKTPKEQSAAAKKLAKNLGIEMKEIPIDEIEDHYATVLSPYFKVSEDCPTEENLTSRIRATLTMAFSNQKRALLLSSANKTELGLGYGSLYGSMAGALCVIGDVLKSNCYDLAHYINRKEEIIPQEIINLPTSQELRHHANDKEFFPSFKVVDSIIKGYVEEYHSPEKIAADNHLDLHLVMAVIRRIYKGEHKRRQAAPSLRVSKKSFAVGRKKPLHYCGSEQEKIY